MPSDGFMSCIDSERFVLGAVFARPEQFVFVESVLLPDDFSLERHRRIYGAMKHLYGKGELIDRIVVGMHLRENGHLESDGLSYMASLNDGMAEIFSVDGYVSRVKDFAIRRHVASTLQKASEELQYGSSTTNDITDRTIDAIRHSALEGQQRAKLRTTGEIIADNGGVNVFLGPQLFGVRSPWPGLDRLTGGFLPGQLIVIAARPAVGKSALAMQVAELAAMDGVTAAVFSLEMTAKELLIRIACSGARVNSLSLRRGDTTPEEKRRLMAEVSRLDSIPLMIDDSPGLTPSALHSAVRRLSARHQVGLVVVDYLQLMQTAGRIENRNQQISEISRALKLVAKEFHVPVIELSQLNRASETEKRRPKLSDLRESGSIEQDADVVMFIHRESLENPSSTLIVAKQRNGPLGDVSLWFRGDVTRFQENHNGRDGEKHDHDD